MVHISSWSYLSSYVYYQPAQNLKNLKICPERPPGAIIDDLERQNETNPSDRSFSKPLLVHKKALEDNCDSIWSYLSSYVYYQPAQNLKNLKICPERPPGTTIDGLERRNETNPSDRRFSKPLLVQTKATEDNCDNSWEYLSSYVYHQPPRIQKSVPPIFSNFLHYGRFVVFFTNNTTDRIVLG